MPSPIWFPPLHWIMGFLLAVRPHTKYNQPTLLTGPGGDYKNQIFLLSSVRQYSWDDNIPMHYTSLRQPSVIQLVIFRPQTCQNWAWMSSLRSEVTRWSQDYQCWEETGGGTACVMCSDWHSQLEIKESLLDLLWLRDGSHYKAFAT